MKTSFILAAALAFAPFAAAMDHAHHGTTQEAAQAAIESVGFVRAIDATEQKVTIEHEAIPALNWPSMTMRFTYDAADRIGGVNVGDKVKFAFVQEGRVSRLTAIETLR
jgi:Cu(I)/Ag(I) efflux system protein CusF